MDALSFNPSQNGAAPTSSIAADITTPDGGVAGIDFAALLALGMNACPQDAAAAQTAEENPSDTTISADRAATPAIAPEFLVALPQQSLSADATPTTALAEPTQTAEVKAGQPTEPQTATSAQGDAAARTDAKAPAAVVADEAANIAGKVEEHASATQSTPKIQDAEQRVDIAAIPQDDVLETRAPHPGGLAAHAAQIHPAESRAPASRPSALLEVQAPVSEPGFAQALSRQVVWMVDKDAQVAELRINPPELGPVEVRLTLTQESAAAEFVSPHAEVRAAIENSIVRLREAMAEAGIHLGEASVSAESFSARDDAQAQSRHARDGYRVTPFAEQNAARPGGNPATVRRGLVDVFA